MSPNGGKRPGWYNFGAIPSFPRPGLKTGT